MTTFTVWKFEEPDGAAHAESLLKTAEADGLVTIVDHAVMSWPRAPRRRRPTITTTTPSAVPPGARSEVVLGGALFAVLRSGPWGPGVG